MKVTISRRKTIIFISAIAIALCVLSVLSQVYQYVFNEGEGRYLVRMFNLDEEFNFPTLFSFLCLLSCSLILFHISVAKHGIRDKMWVNWRLLGITFFVIAVDEMIKLHELLIGPLHVLFNTKGIFLFAWTIPAIFFVLLFFILNIRFLKSLPTESRTRFVIAGIVFVSGALGMEMVGGAIISKIEIENLLYSLITGAEETLELLGVILFLDALLRYVKAHLGTHELSVE
jgi:hypothetical protein